VPLRPVEVLEQRVHQGLQAVHVHDAAGVLLRLEQHGEARVEERLHQRVDAGLQQRLSAGHLDHRSLLRQHLLQHLGVRQALAALE